jgi:hypothetical protein
MKRLIASEKCQFSMGLVSEKTGLKLASGQVAAFSAFQSGTVRKTCF